MKPKNEMVHKAERQPTMSESQASGELAEIAPIVPKQSVSPTTRGSFREGNQSVASFKQLRKAKAEHLMLQDLIKNFFFSFGKWIIKYINCYLNQFFTNRKLS